MPQQDVFRRYELKYLISAQQRDRLEQEMRGRMQTDGYGCSTVRSIYFDTENFRLIRHSLEKPVYKEKLRLRSYARVGPEDTVFLELKKKYQGVVYKRRLEAPEGQVSLCFRNGLPLETQTQIGREIDYFRRFYAPLLPMVFLSCRREGFCPVDRGDLRITLDDHILYRDRDLSLGSDVYGTPLLEDGQTLLEVKTSGGMPLWLSHFLNRERITKTTFSKYGAAYLNMTNGYNRRGGF